MAVADLPDIIHELDRSLTSIEVVVDPDSKKVEIAKLEEESAAPDLWNDQANAQRVTSRLSRLQSEVERVEDQIHAFVNVDVGGALEQAGRVDDARRSGEAVSPLAG